MDVCKCVLKELRVSQDYWWNHSSFFIFFGNDDVKAERVTDTDDDFIRLGQTEELQQFQFVLGGQFPSFCIR